MKIEAKEAESAHAGDPYAPPRICRRACIGLAAATLFGAALNPLLTRADEEEWVEVRDVSLEIAEGSALDFSDLSPQETAGDRGRVVVGPSGQFAFASEPGRPQRFLCASLAWSPASGSFPDKYR